MYKSKTDNIRLNMLGLPVIQTLEDFSRITHISKYTIYQLSKNSSYYYQVFSIPKKSGKDRVICEPSFKMKGMQAWILVNILNKLKVSEYCKGFEKGASIADNAKPHIGANIILTIDLEDFFHSINSGKVFSIFNSIGYNTLISTILTNICTYDGVLPQGSPCSPKLANLSTWSLDVRIQGYVGKRGISYTRYADDLTFSGLSPNNLVKIFLMIKMVINDEGFRINTNKTRISGAARSRKVTGLVLSNDDFGIGSKAYKFLRAKIHRLTFKDQQENLELFNHVRGWLAYLKQVDKKRFDKTLKYIARLSEKNPNTFVNKLIGKK